MKGGPKKQREEEAPVYDIERRDGVTIRRVRPMVQAFETFAKGRWVGREILEVVTKEFGGHTAEYWQSAFHHGHLRINGQAVPPTYRFQNSDRFLHRTHRHEPPILGEVQFLGETRDYFAVNKPASVPVHPCGAFRYNSLEKILLYEPLTPTQPSPLHLVHRLDKVTSGLVIFAKSAQAAAIISRDIQAKSTTKRYLARVKGRFPEQLLQLLHPLEESEIYHYAGGAGDGDEADDGGDAAAAAADGAAVEGEAPPSHGKKRPSTAEPPGASSSAATGASRAERKRQRQEQYGATTGPSAASATDGPVAAGAVVHVAGKSADCAAHRTAPALDDVRAHPAVGYYRRRDAGAGDGDGDGDGDDAYFYVQCPLDVVSKRNGVHACYPPPYGRPSVTKMRLVSFCAASQTSLVECQPVTGRTHQIRLHSQLAGHPIANDPCYGGELFYHDPEKQAQCRAAQELLEACGIAPLSRVLHQPTTTTAAAAAASEASALATAATPSTWALPAIERRVGETDDALLERSCRYCAALRQFPQLRDVEVHLHCDGIWLHAWQYAKTRPPPPPPYVAEGREGGGGGGGDEGDEFWAFEAPPPAWAADTLPLPLAATTAAAAAAVPVPSPATDAAPSSPPPLSSR